MRRGGWLRCRLRFGLGRNLNRRRLWRYRAFLHDLWRDSFGRHLCRCRLRLDDFDFRQLRLAVVLRRHWRCRSWRNCLRAAGRRRYRCRSRSCRRRWARYGRWRRHWCRWRRRWRWRRGHWWSCRGDRGGLRLLSASHRCQDDDGSERDRQPQSLYRYALRFPHVWPIPRLIGANIGTPGRANHYESLKHCKAVRACGSSHQRALRAP